jgi:hypothetical protein
MLAKFGKSRTKIEHIDDLEFKNHELIGGDLVGEVGFSLKIEILIRE